MPNEEVFIVAKPHFERTSSGQNEISIVDVWIVPENGQGRVPANIDDRRAGEAPRCGTQDQQRFYQPLTSQYLNNSFQHMTLVRTARGWEIQPDVDPRAPQYRVPRMSPQPVDQRYVPDIYRGGNCGCYGERPPAYMEPRRPYVDPRTQYMEPQAQYRIQIEPPYSSVDPRSPYRVQPNPQYRAEDPRVSQFNYQRQYQLELQRIPDEELTRRYFPAQWDPKLGIHVT